MKRKIRIVRRSWVIVFYVSRNTTPPSLRVLWKMPREDAKRLCSDSRTAGKNHMLCWTAYGEEGEDWVFVPDKGHYDEVLEDLDIHVLESWIAK